MGSRNSTPNEKIDETSTEVQTPKSVVKLYDENFFPITDPSTPVTPIIPEQNIQQVTLGVVLLSVDCLNHIYDYLELVEQMKARRVCQSFFGHFSSEIRWKQNCVIAQYPTEKPKGQTWRAHFMNYSFPCSITLSNMYVLFFHLLT